MKILLLASINSAHTIKWANGLNKKGMKVLVCGLNNNIDRSQYSNGIELINLSLPDKILNLDFGSHLKFLYIFSLPGIKKIIKEFKPDLLHSHYASSYGILGMLTGFHPFIVSVWGADVFTFPNKSIINKILIKRLFRRADQILSTSHFMAGEINRLTNKTVRITPFGIDTDQFRPLDIHSPFGDNDIIIGTIKGLEYQYGIEHLLKAFKFAADRNPDYPLKLLIVGKGSLESQLKKLAEELNIADSTIFTGFVRYSEVQNYHNMLDIYLALSVIDDESFGVAVLEAGACEKPVIVSDIGGLTEVVENNLTGIIVPSKNPVKAAEAIEFLVKNKEEGKKMGKAARLRILEKYDFEKNLEQMLMIYNNTVNSHN